MYKIEAKLTLHPWSKQFQTAYWFDHYLRHNGQITRMVLFEDSLFIDPDVIKLEVDTSRPAPHDWKRKPNFLEGKNGNCNL